MVGLFSKGKKGGKEMQRTYISGVKPLDNYILQIDFISGSQLLLDMSRQLDSIRFRPLKKREVWQSATTNGIFVRFGNTEIAHDEILAMAEEHMDNQEEVR